MLLEEILKQEQERFIKENLLSDEMIELLKENIMPFNTLMAYYRCAIMEVETKFKVLNEEFSLQYDRNPIESIKSRIKSMDGIFKKAKKKNIPNADFVVGDCENFPFEDNAFDAIICSNSFHHYPNPQAFFDSVKRCLRPNGRLILRDVTSDNKILIWLMNTLEMPLANICGHGDVRVPTRDVVMECSRKAGLKVEKFEIRKGMRMHCVVRKA